MPWRRLLKAIHYRQRPVLRMYIIILYQNCFMVGTPWNQIEIDPCFRRIDCSNLNVHRHSKICQIEVTSIDNGSILISIWYWSMLHFPPRYMKNCQMPTSIFVGCFSPRIARMEKHDGLLHIQVITLQISPWKCVWYRSHRCHYT